MSTYSPGTEHMLSSVASRRTIGLVALVLALLLLAVGGVSLVLGLGTGLLGGATAW